MATKIGGWRPDAEVLGGWRSRSVRVNWFGPGPGEGLNIVTCFGNRDDECCTAMIPISVIMALLAENGLAIVDENGRKPEVIE